MAHQSSLEVIPLVQTFGHMEYVLKHHQFLHLRERQSEDNSICPSREETSSLIKEMVQQLKSLHPHSLRIHMGADEAYYVGEDVQCRTRLNSTFNESIEALKLDHIARTAKVARREGFREVLAWNDMFDKASVYEIKSANLGSLITPVVWGYTTDVTRPDYFPQGLFQRLSLVFPRIWLASAYKGANGATNPFLSIEGYLSNHQSYVRLYQKFHQELEGRVEGIILTGWSRFSHHQPLCELLPIAIPSLVINLIYLQDVSSTSKELTDKTKEVLLCPRTPPSGLYEERRLGKELFYPSREQMFTLCAFPGVDLFILVQDLRFLHWKSQRIEDDERERKKLNMELKEIEVKLRPLLSAVLFDDAVNEFLESYVRRKIVPYNYSSPISLSLA